MLKILKVKIRQIFQNEFLPDFGTVENAAEAQLFPHHPAHLSGPCTEAVPDYRKASRRRPEQVRGAARVRQTSGMRPGPEPDRKEQGKPKQQQIQRKVRLQKCFHKSDDIKTKQKQIL